MTFIVAGLEGIAFVSNYGIVSELVPTIKYLAFLNVWYFPLKQYYLQCKEITTEGQFRHS